MDADNILNEFHKHMEQRKVDIEQQSKDVQNDLLLDFNEILSDDIDDQFFVDFQSDDNVHGHKIIVEELELIRPTIGRPRKSISAAEQQVVKKRAKNKSCDTGDVDQYVSQMFEADITASLKSLERKYKREQLDDGGLCAQCGLSFSNSTEYKKHIRSHDDKGM